MHDMKIVLSLLQTIWAIIKYLCIPVIFLIGLVVVLLAIWFLVYAARGYRPIKGEHNHVRRPPLWRNIFINFPVRYILDFFDRDPEFFTHQGLVVFTGRQGNGKTIAMVEQARLWKQEYPKAKCLTNFGFEEQDDVLDHWTKLIDYKNGIYGVICCMDEMQNWFSSNQSKNFPPEMLEVITQNRKNRRVIMGTAQSFNRLSKPIREQATEVRKCWTFLGCITVVKRTVPELNAAGDVLSWRTKGFYYFVHTQEIRDSYDTYKVIESLREAGFQDRPAEYLSLIQ